MIHNIYENTKSFMKEYWSFILSVIVIILVFFVIKVPYEVEMPGGIINLNDRVQIDGQDIEIEGSFNMAYVSVAERSIPHVLLGLIIPDWEVSPISQTVYDNETIEEANFRNKLYLEQSKINATTVALDLANIPYEISNYRDIILHIDEDAETDLKIGDEIIAIDDIDIEDIKVLGDYTQGKKVGDKLKFKVKRDGKTTTATAKVIEKDKEKRIGISIITQYEIKSEKNIKISSRSSESGPSGGMMMALMIYNAVTEQDLTHGKKIVGTGTIKLDGSVGEIGGVKFKLMGAVKAKADIFLVPEGNYKEALEVKEKKGYDIKIVSIKTLKDAISYLEGL